jgi:hypothetical protein
MKMPSNITTWIIKWHTVKLLWFMNMCWNLISERESSRRWRSHHHHHHHRGILPLSFSLYIVAGDLFSSADDMVAMATCPTAERIDSGARAYRSPWQPEIYGGGGDQIYCSSIMQETVVPAKMIHCDFNIHLNIRRNFDLSFFRGPNKFYLRFEVSTAVTIKNTVFWDVTSCDSCKNRRFGETYRLKHHDEENQRAS